MQLPDFSALPPPLNALAGGDMQTLVALALSALGGKYAHGVYQKKRAAKKGTLKKQEHAAPNEEEQAEKVPDAQISNPVGDDLKVRVEKLEEKLDKAIADKDKLMKQVTELKAQVIDLTSKLELILTNLGVPAEKPKRAVRKRKETPKKA